MSIQEKQKVIEWLEQEKWHPCVKPTSVELETAQLLNDILSDIQERLKGE